MRLGLTVIFAVLWFAALVAVVATAVDVFRGVRAARHAIRLACQARDRMSAETAITAMLANPDLRALVDENPHLLIPLFDRATR